MIIAKATPIGQRLRLEIIHPAKPERIFKMVESIEEGERVVKFINRDYMREKLVSWLNQRCHAVDSQLVLKARALQVMLRYHKNCGFQAFCTVIHGHREEFELLAPGPRSQYYMHYTSQILPLLNDAAEMGGTT